MKKNVKGLTVGHGDTDGVPVTVPGQLVVRAQRDDATTSRPWLKV